MFDKDSDKFAVSQNTPSAPFGVLFYKLPILLSHHGLSVALTP